MQPTNADTPRERRKTRAREAILESALGIVAERGGEGLSMREVAARADYSPSGLYEHFSGKEEILEALRQEGFGRLRERVGRVPDNPPPAERLLEAGLAYLDFARSNPELYRLVFAGRQHVPVSLADVAENSAYGDLLRIVREGVEAGRFETRAGGTPEELAYGCWALVHGVAMLRLSLLSEAGPQLDVANRKTLEAFVDGLKKKEGEQ